MLGRAPTRPSPRHHSVNARLGLHCTPPSAPPLRVASAGKQAALSRPRSVIVSTLGPHIQASDLSRQGALLPTRGVCLEHSLDVCLMLAALCDGSFLLLGVGTYHPVVSPSGMTHPPIQRYRSHQAFAWLLRCCLFGLRRRSNKLGRPSPLPSAFRHRNATCGVLQWVPRPPVANSHGCLVSYC